MLSTYTIIVLTLFLFFAMARIKHLRELLEELHNAVKSGDQLRIKRILKTATEELE